MRSRKTYAGFRHYCDAVERVHSPCLAFVLRILRGRRASELLQTLPVLVLQTGASLQERRCLLYVLRSIHIPMGMQLSRHTRQETMLCLILSRSRGTPHYHHRHTIIGAATNNCSSIGDLHIHE